MLKYFKQDFPHIPVILTGSMVRLKIFRHTHKRKGNKSFLFPIGCIETLTMSGITFEEFLMNVTTKETIDMIKEHYLSNEPLDNTMHNQLWLLYF